MQRSGNRLLTILFAAGLLGGCATAGPSGRIAPGKEYSVQPLPISTAELETRTARLAKRLEQTKMGEKERRIAMDLLNSYQMIGATLQPPLTDGDRQRIIRLLFENLVKMDEQYFAAADKIQENADAFEQYSSRRKEIVQDYLAGDHEMVVNKCIGLQSLFGEGSLPPDIGLLFSVSLSKTGRLREAVEVGEKISKELEKRPDMVNLRAYILEWQLAMGQEKSAQEGLKDLTQRVEENQNLLKEARQRLGILPKEEAPPQQAATPDEIPSPQATPQAPTEAATIAGSLNDSLSEVRELTKKREFTKAKFILLQQRIRFPEGPETAAIDQAMKEVELAEGQSSEAPAVASVAPGEVERFALIKKLVEEENYDEALAKMDELQKEGNAPSEMSALREAATERLINRERNRAAKLYLVARNETDPAKKEELLSSSMVILKNVLEKYPSSPLKKKISDNMAIIRDEMTRIKKRGE